MMSSLVHTKAPPGSRNSEARTVGAVSGFGIDQENVHADHIETANRIQAISDCLAEFRRLESAFDKVGWNLYPLYDESVLAVHRPWGMNMVCPTLREAAALLRRVGGC